MSSTYFPKREKIRVYLFSTYFEKEHFHKDISLLFVVKGEISLKVAEEDILLQESEYFVINSNVMHAISSSQEDLFLKVVIDFDLVRDVIEKDNFLFIDDPRNIEGRQMLKKAIHSLLDYYLKQNRTAVDFAYLSECYHILDILATYFLQEDNNDPVEKEEQGFQTRVQMIDDYIRTNYNQELSLQSLSDYLYLSPSYVSKFFKRQLGMNFKKYVTLVRLDKAYQDVLYTSKTITSIAYDNGFSSSAAFNTKFQDEYGMTALEVRKKYDSSAENVFTISENDKEVISTYLTQANQIQNKRQVVTASALETQPVVRSWQNMFNAGLAEELLNSQMQEQILMLKEKLNFNYLRIWSLFSEELLIDLNHAEKSYNFSKINSILDYFVNNDLIPHIELGNKSSIINKNAHKVLKDKQENDLASEKNFQQLIDTFLRQCIDRYGRQTVNKWRFELWLNKWDFDHNHSIKDYFHKFSELYRVIKKHSTQIKVGGFGYAALYTPYLTNDFIRAWKAFGGEPDFISVINFDYRRVSDYSVRSSERSRDEETLKQAIVQVEKELKDAGWGDKPIYVTEWNLSISDRNYLNDSSFKGAYILEKIFMNINKIPVLSYFGLCDCTSEYYDSTNFLYGGSGLISREGVLKPVGYAFEFLNSLDDYYIEANKHCIITTDKKGNYTILCHNKQALSNLYYITDEDKLDINLLESYFKDASCRDYHFELTNITNGSYRMKIRRVSEEEGAVLGEWRKIGQSENLSLNDIQYIKNKAIPRLEIEEREVDVNKLEFDLAQQPNELTLIKIKKTFVNS